MDHCDVLIVGGGPAGSTCAWRLKQAGLDVLIIEKEQFPRDKVCAGWITPAVFDKLELDPEVYGSGRMLQPITGFRIGQIGDSGVETRYGHTVSYGIRRCEFDHYLALRSSARLAEGTPCRHIEKCNGTWIVNGNIEAGVVVGAGGHFCPVARFLGARIGAEPVITAQEIELKMASDQRSQCAAQAEIPELYFCRDMRGYGWIFRKQDYLNIGLGRLDRHHLSTHVDEFLSFLVTARRIPADFPSTLSGHAYLLYNSVRQSLVGDGILLIGDAAGLAFSMSGEGIRPAIESALLAAKIIVEARNAGNPCCLENYRSLLLSHFGKANSDCTPVLSRLIPIKAALSLAGKLLATRWFSRYVVLDRWFLRNGVGPRRQRSRQIKRA
jgi:geranylgeranyl reductase family protein